MRGWTPGEALRRAREVYRREGPRSLALRVAGEIGYRRMILMERAWEPMRDVEPQVDAEFREATEADAGAIGNLLPQADADEVRRRLAAGHHCWVALHGGRIVQCFWIGIGRARIDYLDTDIVLPPRVGYLYDLYTAPDVRGLGLHRAMYPHMIRAFDHVQPEGVCAAFHPENRMHRVFARVGFREVARIGYLGIGRRRRFFYRPTGVAATPRARRSRLRRGELPSFPGASTPRSPGRAS